MPTSIWMCFHSYVTDFVYYHLVAVFFRWAMSSGYGACLINKPELVKDMVTHVRNQVDNPNYAVSIKIR